MKFKLWKIFKNLFLNFENMLIEFRLKNNSTAWQKVNHYQNVCLATKTHTLNYTLPKTIPVCWKNDVMLKVYVNFDQEAVLL